MADNCEVQDGEGGQEATNLAGRNGRELVCQFFAAFP